MKYLLIGVGETLAAFTLMLLRALGGPLFRASPWRVAGADFFIASLSGLVIVGLVALGDLASQRLRQARAAKR